MAGKPQKQKGGKPTGESAKGDQLPITVPAFEMLTLAIALCEQEGVEGAEAKILKCWGVSTNLQQLARASGYMSETFVPIINRALQWDLECAVFNVIAPWIKAVTDERFKKADAIAEAHSKAFTKATIKPKA